MTAPKKGHFPRSGNVTNLQRLRNKERDDRRLFFEGKNKMQTDTTTMENSMEIS